MQIHDSLETHVMMPLLSGSGHGWAPVAGAHSFGRVQRCGMYSQRCVDMCATYERDLVMLAKVNSDVATHAGVLHQMDDALGQAQAVASNLSTQRQLFDNMGGKLMTIGSKFPVVNGLLNTIRRKKNRVSTPYMM